MSETATQEPMQESFRNLHYAFLEGDQINGFNVVAMARSPELLGRDVSAGIVARFLERAGLWFRLERLKQDTYVKLFIVLKDGGLGHTITTDDKLVARIQEDKNMMVVPIIMEEKEFHRLFNGLLVKSTDARVLP